MIAHQEKPVAAPGDVPGHHSIAFGLDRDLRGSPVTRHVLHRHLAALMQNGLHRPDRSFDRVLAGRDLAEVRQSHHQADRSMAAHPQIADVVEEDRARGRLRVDRVAEQRAHDHIRSSGLVDNRRAEVVEVGAEAAQPVRHRSCAEIGPAGNHHARRLPARMRIDDTYPVQIHKNENQESN